MIVVPAQGRHDSGSQSLTHGVVGLGSKTPKSKTRKRTIQIGEKLPGTVTKDIDNHDKQVYIAKSFAFTPHHAQLRFESKTRIFEENIQKM